MADEKIQIDITAKDDASKKLDEVADSAEALEKLSPEVAVTADTDAAQSDLASISKLAAADQTLVIKAQIDQAEGELKRLKADLAAVDDASAATGKKIGDEMEAGTGKAKDATHSLAGAAIGDSLGAATGFGALGESVSQVTEGILAGEVAMKDLLSAGLAMGAITLVVQTVTNALAETKAVDAFNKKKVDDFVKSLRTGKTVLETLNDELRETGRIEFADQVTGKTKDLVGTLANANITWEEFLSKIALGKDGFKEWVIAAGPAIGAGNDLNVVIQAGNQFIDDRTAAEKAFTDQQKVMGTTASETERELHRLNNTFDTGTDSIDHATDANDALARSLKGTEQRADDTRDAFDRMRGTLNVEKEALDFATQMQTALDNTKTKAGNTDAEILAIKQSIIDAGETAHKNPVEVQSELAKVDQGDLLTVASDVEGWYRQYPITLASKLDRPKLVAGGGTGSGGGGVGPQMVGPQIVNNINMPAGSRGVDVVRQVAGQARRSGRRYGSPVVHYARR